MKSVRHTHHLLLATALLAGISALLYSILYTKIAALAGDLSVARVELAQQSAMRHEEQMIATFLSDTLSDREELSMYLFSSEDPTPFLSLLESLAAELGVEEEVRSIAEVTSDGVTKASASPGGHGTVELTLSVSGSWDALYRLLYLFEYLPQVTTVDHLSLSRDDSSGVWDGLIRLRVSSRVADH